MELCFSALRCDKHKNRNSKENYLCGKKHIKEIYLCLLLCFELCAKRELYKFEKTVHVKIVHVKTKVHVGKKGACQNIYIYIMYINACTFVYTYISMYIYIYIYIHTYVYVYMYIYIHTYKHTYFFIYVQVHIYIYIQICISLYMYIYI